MELLWDRLRSAGDDALVWIVVAAAWSLAVWSAVTGDLRLLRHDVVVDGDGFPGPVAILLFLAA